MHRPTALVVASTCLRNSAPIPAFPGGGIDGRSSYPAPNLSRVSSELVFTHLYVHTPSAPATMTSSRVGLNTMLRAGPCDHFMLDSRWKSSSYTFSDASSADARYTLCCVQGPSSHQYTARLDSQPLASLVVDETLKEEEEEEEEEEELAFLMIPL